MKHVVVLLSLSECYSDPNTRCVMEVHGPYEAQNDEERKTILASFPESFTPHWIRLNDPNDNNV